MPNFVTNFNNLVYKDLLQTFLWKYFLLWDPIFSWFCVRFYLNRHGKLIWKLRKFVGSSVQKASAVEYRSTLHRHLGWHSIDTRSISGSTVDRQSINSGSTYMSRSTLDRLSADCWSCFDWEYQSTLDRGCPKNTRSNLLILRGIGQTAQMDWVKVQTRLKVCIK